MLAVPYDSVQQRLVHLQPQVSRQSCSELRWQKRAHTLPPAESALHVVELLSFRRA